MSGADLSRRTVIGGGALLGVSALRAETPLAIPSILTAPAGQFTTYDHLDGVAKFRGIRYGRAERFRAPMPVPRFENWTDTEKFAPVAPQAGDRYGPQSEDCLFLNIWTPSGYERARKLPVMVYFHGGAYATGSVTDPLNNGRELAKRSDIVVVTVNHRLNALGYLYLARLDPRFPDSGNLGQLDLILALKWIRTNIASFGGDPGRVTVFGQSGGGAKIATLMAMPAAHGLLHRAVTMSGQQVTASGPLNATRRTQAYMAKLGAKTVDDLLAIPPAKLIEGLAATDPILGGGVYFGPVLDMRHLARHPFWPDAAPQGNAVPMMLGNTRDETRGFIPLARLQDLTWDNLPARIAPELRIDVLPEWVVAEYRKQYPAWSPVDIFYAATTAGRSWRGQVIEAEERARAGAPTWVYQLDFASRTDPRRGAFHTMDIPLAFGTLDAPGSETGTGADARAASKALQDSLVTFARTGDPNHAGLPRWPRYDLKARATLIVDARARIEHDPRRWQRELFARIPYIQPGT